MCMIAWIPAKAATPWEMLADGGKANPDGVGVMWAYDGRLNVRRSTDVRRVWDFLTEVPIGVGCAVHFRLATHGRINKRNCHPYRVTENVYLMHNGILPLKDSRDIESDTGLFAKRILRPLLLDAPHLYGTVGLDRMLRLAGGSSNKFLLMHASGSVRIINEEAGFWEDGCWFSSRPWVFRSGTSYGIYGDGSYYESSTTLSSKLTSIQLREDRHKLGFTDEEVEAAVEANDPDALLYQEWLAGHASDDGPEEEEETESNRCLRLIRAAIKAEQDEVDEAMQANTAKLALLPGGAA